MNLGGQNLRRKGFTLVHLPGAVRTAIVEYDMDIEAMGMVTDKRFDNVRFILDAADCD